MRNEVITCDRCRGVCAAADPTGQIYAAMLSGRDIVGTRDAAADLCGNCLEDLAGFMSELAPTPAPAASKPKRMPARKAPAGRALSG